MFNFFYPEPRHNPEYRFFEYVSEINSNFGMLSGLTSFTGGTVSGQTNFTNGLIANSISAGTINITYVGSGTSVANLGIDALGNVVYGSPGIYTTGFTYDSSNKFTISNSTGGTLSAVINTVTGLTVNGLLSSTSLSATSLSAGSIFSTTFSSNTISGGTINSGSTNLYNIFSRIEDLSRVQPGTNTYTGGTATAPTVNVSALTINTLTASGTTQLAAASTTALSAGTFSGGTIYSGGTNLYNIFSRIQDLSRIQPGINTYTGGTTTAPTINVSALTINTLTASGTTQLNGVTSVNLSGGTLSGGTIFSANTNFYDIFQPIGANSVVINGANTYTGGTFYSPTVNVSALTINTLIASGITQLGIVTTTSLSGGTISGGTLFSGATNLNSIFHPIGSVSSIVGGINTYTGGTFYSPTVNVSALTINTLTASGSSQLNGVTSTSLSGGTLSGGTIYSGSTNLYNIFQPGGANSVNSGGVNTYTGGTFYNQTINVSALTINTLIVSGTSQLDGTTSTNLSGGTLSGGTIYSGSTNIRDIFVSEIDFQTLTSGDTNTLTTTSTSYVDVPGMSLITKNINIGSNTAVTYQVTFNCGVTNGSGGALTSFRLLRNGLEMSGSTRAAAVTITAAGQVLNLGTIAFANNVSVGETFKAQWRVSAGTGTMSGRTISIIGILKSNVS